MTGLGRDAPAALRFVAKYILPAFVPFIKYMSTPQPAAHMLTQILIDKSGQTNVYFDENDRPMIGSELARDPKFTSRVVAETGALLATVPSYVRMP